MSIKNVMKTIWKNQKIELFVLMGAIVFGVVLFLNAEGCNDFSNEIMMAFDDTRLDFIISSIAIILGIYIAVISIIATSVLGITKDMLEKKMDKQLLQIVFSGMIINVVLVFFCVIFSITIVWQALIVITLLLISFVSFLKFILLLFLIFQANFNQMSKQITEETLEKEELITLLKKIEQKLSKK